MMKNKLFLFALLGVLIMAAPAIANAKAATSIDTAPSATTVKAGEKVTWTVTATYDDASTEDVSAFADFVIPATAGGSLASNVFTTEVPGTYTIPVTVGNFSDSVTLTVVHGDPISLELSQSTTSLIAGSGSVSFTGTLLDAVGNEWDATGQLTLTTDAPQATLSGTSFTSTKAGTWTVTGNVGGLKASKQVTVLADTATVISISGDEQVSLKPGASIDLNATAKDQFGNEVTVVPTWAVSNDVVTVDANGIVKAQKVGEATVTASGTGDLLASKKIVVEAEQTNTNASTNTNTGSNENTNTSENANDNTNTEESAGQTDNEQSDDSTCERSQTWILVVILAVYALILYAYYMLIRKEDDKSWWIFPVLLTVIGVIVWNKYLCPGTIAWFPWVLVAVGLALTGYGRSAMRSHASDETEPPSGDSQKPMF